MVRWMVSMALLGAVLGASLPAAAAADVSVASGSSVALDGADLDLAEGDLTVAGSFLAGTGLVDRARDVTIQAGGVLNGESATIQVCGDWTNGGTFTPGTSLVRFLDGCGTSISAIGGNSTFYNLTFTSGSGRLVSFAAGSTTTVQNFLDLQGASGNLLQVRSSAAGSEAYLDLQGGHAANYVDVDDSHATGNPITIDLGLVGANAPGWSLVPLLVPALGPLALGVLAAALLWLGKRTLARAA